MSSELGGTPLQPWMSLARRNRHPRDNCIVFDEPTHVYTVNGSSKGIVSITQFLHKFFPHFDADQVIKNMMSSKKWPQSKWFGKTADEIKAAWNANGREASEMGTAMHLGCEMAMNDAWDEIPAEVKKTVEWEYFNRYWDKYKDELEPWRTEWEVWDEELKLAGSIDMVYRKKSDGTYCVYDWKRAKEIKFENDFQSGYGPVKHLPDTNYWHYTLQLNMYRWLLERHYGIKISEMALIILHPNNKSYKRIVLNRLDEEIEGMVEARRRAIALGSKEPVVFEEDIPAPLFVND
jgi:PD-(D/E)XK nuclease superfamily